MQIEINFDVKFKIFSFLLNFRHKSKSLDKLNISLLNQDLNILHSTFTHDDTTIP